MTDIHYSSDNFEQIYIVGVRIYPDNVDANLYALVLYNEVARGDDNRPLTSDGRIVFFADPKDARRALALGDSAFRKYERPPDSVAVVYDLAAVTTLIRGGEEDGNGIVADTLNELFDFVAATRFRLSGAFKDVLFQLADHTTFDKSLSAFFGSNDGQRELAENAFLWCVGAVAMSSRLLD